MFSVYFNANWGPWQIINTIKRALICKKLACFDEILYCRWKEMKCKNILRYQTSICITTGNLSREKSKNSCSHCWYHMKINITFQNREQNITYENIDFSLSWNYNISFLILYFKELYCFSENWKMFNSCDRPSELSHSRGRKAPHHYLYIPRRLRYYGTITLTHKWNKTK